MKKLIFIILLLAALVIILPLSFNNSTEVDFNYILGHQKIPLSFLIFGAFIAGALFALPFFALTGWGWKLKAKGLKKQVDELIKQRQRDEIATQFHDDTQNKTE